MADGIRVEVDKRSVNVLLSNIENFRAIITHRSVVKAMEDWALLVQQRARANVPVDSGKLRDSINWLVLEATEDYIMAKVTCMDASGAQLPYAWITEVGGVINAAPGSILHWNDRETGEPRYAKQVYHPAQPFLYPAMVSTIPDGIKFLEQAFEEAKAEI